MNNYEKNFIDWDKRRDDASWTGFKEKNYTLMYNFLTDVNGKTEASYFLLNMNKYQKRCFCCINVIKYHVDEKKRKKALKWWRKKGVEGFENIRG